MQNPVPEHTGDPQFTDAPEHFIDMLLGVMRPFPGPAGAAGSVAYARAARAEARVYANRIWAEAFHAGATYATAHFGRPLVELVVTADQAEQIVEQIG